MPEALLNSEVIYRLTAFIGVFVIMALWEIASPCRRIEIPRLLRWTNNIGIVVLDTIIVRLSFPLLAVGVALLAEEHSWGILNLFHAPFWLICIISILALDVVIYLQHRIFHNIPILWRIHRVHHTDIELDVSTAVRFHPVEILLSMAIKLVAVIVLGVPAVAVLIFEIVLSATSLFNHANVKLPGNIDRVLRRVIVTPDMHRVHHSIYSKETNSNYGFSLSCWDRIFGTYHAQPKDGHQNMAIGLDAFRSPREIWIDKMLIQPIKNRVNAQSNIKTDFSKR